MTLLEATQTAHLASLGAYGAGLAASAANGALKHPLLRRAGLAAAAAGLAVQAGLLAARWYAAGFLPVTGLFSALHFLTLFVVLITLYFTIRYDAGNLLPGALALALVALWKAGDGEMDLKPLIPSLDTPLFFLHVATSFAAYGLFGVAALIGFHRMAGISASGTGAERRMLDECLYIGYILFSWCMVAGSLWAFLAWGSYWSWRVKGLWSMIVWFYYSAVLHVRARPQWQGWRLDTLSIVGFGLVMFTFLGLALVLQEASHPLR